ncbi:MAG: lysylphosphatidylglycerol synthase transmembrane domain-containing protein [Chloroflexota bacterium]
MASFRKHLPSILRWLGTLLTLGLLIWLLGSQGWENIFAAFRQIAWWRLALALAATVLSRLAVATRWFALLRGARVKAPFGLVTRITFAGLFASNFLPTTIGGDVIRLGGAVRFGFSRAISLASLMVDRLVGMAGMAMALPGLLALVGKFPGSFFFWPLASVSSTAMPRWDALRSGVRRISDVLARWIKNPGSLLAALACTWVHMVCTFVAVDLILAGMGQSVSFWLIAGLWSLVYFVTLLPISVNGMGTQELAISLLFTRLGGVSAEGALVMALLMRVFPMLASLPGAVFVPGMIAGNPETD